MGMKQTVLSPYVLRIPSYHKNRPTIDQSKTNIFREQDAFVFHPRKCSRLRYKRQRVTHCSTKAICIAIVESALRRNRRTMWYGPGFRRQGLN